MENQFKDYIAEEDKIVAVALPKEQVEILKQVIKREQAHNWFVNSIKSWWIWIVAGGVLTFLALYDKLGFIGSKLNG